MPLSTRTQVVLSAAVSALLASAAMADENAVPGSTSASREYGIFTTGATALASFTTATGNRGPYLVGYDRTANVAGADALTYDHDSNPGTPDITIYGMRVGNTHYSIPSGFSAGQAMGIQSKSSINSSIEPALTDDRLYYAYHNTGSVNGIRNLVNAQGLFAGIGQVGVGANNGMYVMGVLNTNPSGSWSGGGYTINQPYIPTIAYSDVAANQAFALGGTAAVNKAPGTEGYGKGRPNSLSGRTGTNMQELGDIGGLDDPGDQYSAGAATLANRIRNEALAVVPFTMSASPGTGLDSISEQDAKFLNTSGRLQNGANFNFTTRDIGSGTRNQGGNNFNIDPSWASGERDRIALADASGVPSPNGPVTVLKGQEQAPTRDLDGDGVVNFNEHRPSAIARFADKTSGTSGLRETLTRQRMAIGILSSGDTGSRGKSYSDSNPLRVLAIDFVEDNSLGGEPTAGPVQPTAVNVTEGQYQFWSASQAVTVVAIDGSGFAKTDGSIKGDTDDVADATGGLETGHGISRKFLDNITKSIDSGPSSTTVATPFDALLNASFIPPTLMAVTKGFDGSTQDNRTRTASQQAIWNAVVGSPTGKLTQELAWVRGGDQNGNAASQKYRVYDVNTATAAAGASGDLEINLDSNTFLVGDFNRDGRRDAADTRSLAQAFANTGDYLAAHPTVTTTAFTSTGNLDTSALSTNGHAALLAISDFDGDGNVIVRDSAGNDVELAKDLSNASTFLSALGTSGGGVGRDRVVAITRKDVKNFLYGAAINTDPTAPTFDGTKTLSQIYSDPTLVRARDLNLDGDTSDAGEAASNFIGVADAVNRRELGVRYGRMQKNQAIIDYNDELDDLVTAGEITQLQANAAKVDRFDVDGSSDHALGSATKTDALIVHEMIGRDFTNLDDVLSTNVDLVAAELTDDNVIDFENDFSLIANSGGVNGSSLLLIGDATLDDSVGFSDFDVWIANFGTASAVDKWGRADFDGNGSVGFADFDLWLSNFGTSLSVTEMSAYLSSQGIDGYLGEQILDRVAAVPEPSVAALALTGLIGLRRRRTTR
jgi:hypothetical protein